MAKREVLGAHDHQIGKIVHYVQKVDTNPTQEVPNTNPAIITQVYKDGKCDLHVMHSGGNYSVLRKAYDPSGTRGTFHWPDESTGPNG